MDCLEFIHKYEHITDPVIANDPPDFSELDKALEEGLDINIFDTSETSKDMQDTLLSLILADHGEFLELDEYPQLPVIVRYFLEHGYNVKLNDGYNGILALYALVYPFAYDKYTVEAAKLLLEAGVQTDVPVFPDDPNPKHTSLYYLFREHDGDYRGITDDDLNAANYFYAIWKMIEYGQKGLPYSGVHHYKWAEGRRIQGIYLLDDFREKTDGHDITHRYSFEKIYLDCEGTMLNISRGFSMIVDPNLGGDNRKDFQDCSSLFPQYIGQTIKNIMFRKHAIEHYSPTVLYECCIELDGGGTFIVSEACLSYSPPEGFFKYLDES